MKKLILCVVFFMFSVSCDPVTYDAFAGISGQVIDFDTQAPISGAQVDLNPTGKSIFTGSDGQFEFQELDPGQYTVTVQTAGYTLNRKTVMTVAGELAHITIILSKKEAD
ncbi:carboxypeptidase regulatory-like domain-containing protein [bacterium]|nr:carboxypeptidase regulatory-like domain-containing protein [bacterium]